MKVLRVLGEPRRDPPTSAGATAHEGEGVAGRVAELERLLDEKTLALERAEATGAKSRCFLTRVVESMSSGLWVFEADGRTEMVNAEGVIMAGGTAEYARSRRFEQVFSALAFDEVATPGTKLRLESALTRADGTTLPVLLSTTVVTAGPCEKTQLIVTCEDLTDQKAMQSRLRTAQKLEAVGQLAAGVAHEVNTPIQFIGDSVRFLQDCLRDLSTAAERAGSLFAELKARGSLTEEDERRWTRIRADADADFIFEEAPAATERTLRGVARVAEIVRALRSFAHPDNDTISPGDVNAAVRDASVVAKAECKRVADVVLELGELPTIDCNLNELTQVFLNLLVNAAHAIDARPQGGRGKIEVRSDTCDGFVRVTFTDDGAGIPDAVQTRIFEPFFTTKALGEGTGQGLALAHAIVEKHHRGQLTFTTAAGRGTTFSVQLPLRGEPSQGAPR